MRLCFLSPSYGSGETGGQIGDMARTLAARGHEMTVICASPYRHPFVEFTDGVWVHGVVDSGFLARFRRNYRAAAAREIARIQPRRDFQLVCGPLTEAKAAPIDTIEKRLQEIVAGGGGETIHLEKIPAEA
jgi:glycogen(starch) synthase